MTWHRDVHSTAVFATYRGGVATSLRLIADRLDADPDLVFHGVHNDGEVLHVVFEQPTDAAAVSPKEEDPR